MDFVHFVAGDRCKVPLNKESKVSHHKRDEALAVGLVNPKIDRIP
jgi:hypothetical protein